MEFVRVVRKGKADSVSVLYLMTIELNWFTSVTLATYSNLCVGELILSLVW